MHRGNAEEEGEGEEAARLLQMCADPPSSRLIRYREAQPVRLPSSFTSHATFPFVPPSIFLAVGQLSVSTLHSEPRSPVCPREKDDPVK